MNYSVNNCTLIDFGVTDTGAGFFVDPLRNGFEAPFPVKRMYYLFDIPDNKVVRGGHAHKALFQIVVAIKGSFSLKLSDGYDDKLVILDSPMTGLLLVPGIWREVFDFTPGATCMVLASEVYDEKDYIRSYDEFLIFRGLHAKTYTHDL
jgi:dTDP-4-dehydrorhamnose 3,5-epimerase-like enzyme